MDEMIEKCAKSIELNIFEEIRELQNKHIADLLAVKLMQEGIRGTVIYEDPVEMFSANPPAYTIKSGIKDLILDFSEHDKRVIEEYEKRKQAEE